MTGPHTTLEVVGFFFSHGEADTANELVWGFRGLATIRLISFDMRPTDAGTQALTYNMVW